MSTHTVVRRFLAVSSEARDLGHRLDADNTLDGQVGLVRECASEVVRAELVRRDERICNEELRPLIKEITLQVKSVNITIYMKFVQIEHSQKSHGGSYPQLLGNSSES